MYMYMYKHSVKSQYLIQLTPSAGIPVHVEEGTNLYHTQFTVNAAHACIIDCFDLSN